MVAFSPGAVLTAANLNTAFNALTIRTVTGVSDTLVLADNGGAVTYSNASATTSTIPPNSSVAFATGTKIVLVNLGAGVVTVTAGAGVTVNGSTLTLAQNAGGTCIKTATNTWSFLPFSSGVGNAVYSDANTGTYTGYAYKTFTASGTITVTTAGFADLVVVGGGAGGGYSSTNGGGGGGGGGGALRVTNAYLPAGTLTVVVGAGGTLQGLNSNAPGINGNTSLVGPFVAPGGGGGGAFYGILPGGSGGGADGSSVSYATGAAGVSTLGNAGGNGSISSGGGGGAGAVGVNGATTVGGAGGAGATTTIAGTTPSGAYVAGTFTFAGGGGGGATGTAGAGGAGGGGAGGVNAGAATNGTANTGGGGGSRNGSPANGGSGIVIVRVAV